MVMFVPYSNCFKLSLLISVFPEFGAPDVVTCGIVPFDSFFSKQFAAVGIGKVISKKSLSDKMSVLSMHHINTAILF